RRPGMPARAAGVCISKRDAASSEPFSDCTDISLLLPGELFEGFFQPIGQAVSRQRRLLPRRVARLGLVTNRQVGDLEFLLLVPAARKPLRLQVSSLVSDRPGQVMAFL